MEVGAVKASLLRPNAGSVYMLLSECVCVGSMCMCALGEGMGVSQAVSIYLPTGRNLQQTRGVTGM